MGGMNMPFSRPGAIDLSALKQPAPTAGGAGHAGGAYSVDVTEQNFQSLLEASMTAPVALVVHSPSKLPESTKLAEDLSALADQAEGRYAVGRVDVDTQPAIAQAMQVQSVPLVAMVIQGRLAPLLQDVPPPGELRLLMDQVMQQMATQGVVGRHQPFGAAQPTGETESQTDPRYQPAEDALVAGELATAIAEYEKLLAANPADAEASVGLARAKLMQRTADVDLNVARQAAADAPADVEAQILVADCDLLGGHVDDAFRRLVDLVRRTAGDERERTRAHLVELFAVVGNDDPRVVAGRQALASALF
jgi:putative thioredoxin